MEEFQKRAQALCDEFRSYGGEMVCCLTNVAWEPDKAGKMESIAQWEIAWSVGTHPDFPQLMFQKGESIFGAYLMGWAEAPSGE